MGYRERGIRDTPPGGFAHAVAGEGWRQELADTMKRPVGIMQRSVTDQKGAIAVADTQTRYEEFKIAGDDLLNKVRELIREGNIRRVFLKNDEGDTLLEIPLTAGLAVTVVTATLAPVLVAVGAIAALLTQVTVGVERGISDAE